MITLDTLANEYHQQFEVVATIDLDQWYDHDDVYARVPWLKKQLRRVYKEVYENQERILFTLTRGDEYHFESDEHGVIFKNLLGLIAEVDISPWFVVFLTNDTHLKTVLEHAPVDITVRFFDDPARPVEKSTVKPLAKNYVNSYNDASPIKISLDSVTEKQKNLLTKSRVFCIYPWTHLHVYPTGEAWPCCHAEWKSSQVGSTKQNTLKEIWNNDRMKQLRKNMLNGESDPLCHRCYEQEDSGFFSGRQSANKHHGHHISRVEQTQPDGHLDQFEMVYWDIRYSNLCNLSCRSCGHIFSSSWYQDQAKLAGPEWKKNNNALNIAGRWETDLWEQVLEHIDYVEQIYFAGGEPLLMIEHYKILEELERRKKFHVRLIYNTNFTEVKLKDRLVFDYWKKFDSVSVGASLDAQGARAEYIRKGTHWDRVEQNRRQMLEICPNVDFYISATLSIMNAWHIVDFHRDWTDRGLIKASDFNVNILQDPDLYRIDIANSAAKDQLRERYHAHIKWLESKDPLGRATVGYRSAINYMDSQDNSDLLKDFWKRTNQLDQIRNENALDVLPELKILL